MDPRRSGSDGGVIAATLPSRNRGYCVTHLERIVHPRPFSSRFLLGVCVDSILVPGGNEGGEFARNSPWLNRLNRNASRTRIRIPARRERKRRKKETELRFYDRINFSSLPFFLPSFSFTRNIRAAGWIFSVFSVWIFREDRSRRDNYA